MEYIIEGTTLPILTITLNKGESVYSSTGSLVSMSDSIAMSSEMVGGLLRAVRRLAGRETMFLTKFTAFKDGEHISFSDKNTPGTTKPFFLDGTKELICERASFLCSEDTIDLDISFLRKISSGIFGGEGFIFLRLSGKGYAFLHPYGEIKEHTLAAGERILVSTGKLVAFENTVTFNVIFLKKLKNILFSREGLFITELIGPGKVYVQSTVKKDERKQK
jgi:uncharacterized protein (TIGR00266 family)